MGDDVVRDNRLGNAGEHLVASQINALGFHCELTRNTDRIDAFVRFGRFAPGQSLWLQVKPPPATGRNNHRVVWNPNRARPGSGRCFVAVHMKDFVIAMRMRRTNACASV